jgi:putative acetyltransferase
MHANSPSGHVFALDWSALQQAEVSFYTLWEGEDLLGFGALKELDALSGEIKSMRTADEHLRKGVAAAILEYIIAEARRRGYSRLSLETGSGPAFDPALTLYRKYGFLNGGAFGQYEQSSFNQFLHVELEAPPRRPSISGRGTDSTTSAALLSPPRSTRAFCVGQAKSGTASLCGLLSGAYRAVHEPERAEVLGVILREARGEMTHQDVRAWLVERDERLALDYDIAWANQFLVGHLPDVFPEARFVVLIRDPYTWLGSVAGHLLSRDIPPEVRAFLDWWFRPDEHPPGPGDEALVAAGLYSVGAFLAAWNRHLDTCRAALPAARTLALRTHELRRSHARLAEFLAIPADTLSVERGHLNQRTWTGSLEDLVSLEHLESSVARRCAENLRRYFPEIRGLEDAMVLENSGRN